MSKLLEKMRSEIGCEFISDLRFGKNNKTARQLLKNTDLHKYPLPEAADAVKYIFFCDDDFKSVLDIEEFLTK